MSNASTFFSDLGGLAYDQQIVRAVPPYQDMLGALISTIYLPQDKPLHVLELGCGTGNVALALTHVFSQVRLTAVDLSGPMLQACEQKVSAKVLSFTGLETDFLSVSLPDASVDLVISSLALHHLPSADKRTLYSRIGQWLKPGGLFRCADQCLGIPNQFVMADYWRRWQTWASNNGASDEEIQAWLTHCRTMDHYDSLEDHFHWLQTVGGLVYVDCYWRTLFWTVFGGQKPL